MHNDLRPLRRHFALLIQIALLSAAGVVACSGTPDPPGATEDTSTQTDTDVSTSEDTGDDTITGDTSTSDTSMSDTSMTDTDEPDMGVTCTAPAAECDGDTATVCETDLSSSPQHCGQCGNVCGSAEVCSNGECTADCAGGTQNCNGACVDVTTSAAHCGSCGNTCSGAANAMAVCIGSACGAECVTGYDDCDADRLTNGCEINIDTDPANCGACGTACPGADNADPACTAGVCELSCQSGFDDCDGDDTNGCEVDLNATAEHCGACNNACAGATNADGACNAGACEVVCQAGFDTCVDGSADDGCETDLMTDDAHCGACGNGCGAVTNGTTTCQDGMCMVDSCTPGYHDLDRDASNGCEFRLVANAAKSGLPAGMTGAVQRLALFQPTSGNDKLLVITVTSPIPNLTYGLWSSDIGGANPTLADDIGFYRVAAGPGVNDVVVYSHTAYNVMLPGFGTAWYSTDNSVCDTTCTLNQVFSATTLPVDHGPSTSSIIHLNSEGLKWSAQGGVGLVLGSAPCVNNTDVVQTCRVDEVALSNATAFTTFEDSNLRYVLVAHGDPAELALFALDETNETLDPVTVQATATLGLPAGTPVTDLAYLPGDADAGPGFVLTASDTVQVYRFLSGTVDSWMLEAELTGVTGSRLQVLDSTRVLFSGGNLLYGLHSSPSAPANGVWTFDSLPVYHQTMVDPESNTFFGFVYSTNVLDAFTWSVTP